MGVLDECQPKQRGEVLVNGFCFTANAVPRTGASVRLAIGSVDKTLYVIGDRVFRVDGTASDPTPFTKMPIGYERAFGGPGFPDNPVGVGATPRREGGADVHRLPNVEDPQRLIKQRGDQPPPAGFGPYERTWPKRWSKIGTYDMRWLKTEAPGARATWISRTSTPRPTTNRLRVFPGRRDLHAREHAPAEADADRAPPAPRRPVLPHPAPRRRRRAGLSRGADPPRHHPSLPSSRARARRLPRARPRS